MKILPTYLLTYLPTYLLASALLLAVSFAAPAHACQLICLPTTSLHNGNLGGLPGADAICSGEFPGFKFPRSSMLFANQVISGDRGFLSAYGPRGASYGIYAQFWAGATNQNTSRTIYNCNNWNDATSGSYGGVGHTSYDTKLGIGVGTANPNVYGLAIGDAFECSYKLPLICCNM